MSVHEATFHLTGAEGTVIAAAITSAGYFVLSRRQKTNTTVTVEAKDVLDRVERRVDDLAHALQNHTSDDTANFRELRDRIDRRPRGRGWFMPALGLLVHLFLK